MVEGSARSDAWRRWRFSRLRRPRRSRRTLASQILSLHLAIIVAALVVGVAASLWVARNRLDEEYGQRALAIAESVAALPSVKDAVGSSSGAQTIQPVAMSVQRSSGASFVVVMNRAGIRYSHPDPRLIGQRVDDVGPALDGRPWIGSDNGAVGPSMRAKAPILGSDGSVIGVVSVGFREDLIGSALTGEIPAVAATLGSALALAAAGSILLARHVKRKTFGLEPDEIAQVLEQREAILHGIREGTIASDLRGRITLINDEARDLLGLDESCIGQRVDDMLPPGRIREMLHGVSGESDEAVVAGERLLVANRMPVAGRSGVIGYVVTLRDRTELEGVLRELDSVRSLTDALRAQAHEFSNRLHTLAGLIELGRQDEALRLIHDETSLQQELAERLVRRIGDPMLTALLLGKSVVASERGIELDISDDTALTSSFRDPRALVTIVGNLVDNAFDAVVALPPGAPRWVRLTVRVEEDDVVIHVRDSGPGVDPGLAETIFDEGVSSKLAGERPRGLGLALVRQAVRRCGGTIEVRNPAGAHFHVRLPLAVDGSGAPPAPASQPATDLEAALR